MTISLSVAVMAHPKRKTFIPELLAALDRPATVVWDAGDNNRWNTGRRAMLARDPQATHHLVLQDDAVTCRDLIAGVERALKSVPDGSPVSLYCGRTRPYRELVKQLVGRATRDTSWLTMAQLHWGVGIVMPTKWIGEMVAWCDQRTDVANYDKRISRWIQQRRLSVFYAWPSLVDHRDSPSLVPGRGSANRRAHRFIGVTASALRQRWDGAVVSIPALSLTDSSAPGQSGGRGPVRFASVKYPNLHIPTIEVRFRDGFADVTRRSAIAYLNSPWMRRRGVRLASEVEEEQSTSAPVVEVVQAPLQVRLGDGEHANGAEPLAETTQSATADPTADTSSPAVEPSQPEPTVDSAVPEGTAAAVMAWVGDDRERARQALDAEQGRDKPRTSLVAKLTPLAKRRVVAATATATMPGLTANDNEENPDG